MIEQEFKEFKEFSIEKFEQIDKRFEQVDKRFEQLENKMEEGFKGITKLIMDIFDNIDSSIKSLEESQKIMMKKIDSIQASDLSSKEWLNTLEYRIQRIEDKVFGNRIAEDKENYSNN